MKNVTAIVAIILCALCFYLGRSCESGVAPSNEVVVDSTTTEQTIPDFAPAIRDSVVVRYRYEVIPITQSSNEGDTVIACAEPLKPDSLQVVARGDSAEVIIPITQKVYEDEGYRAYVSGYHASLDSIFINHSTTTIKIREPTKPKRFSIGLQAGYGMTPKGFQPYVGIGVSVNLWSF